MGINFNLQDARIIVGLFYAKAARKVLCEIYKNEMYGKKYVWFFIGWYEDNWFNSEKHLKEENIGCSRQEMEKAAEGHFTTEALQWNSDRYSPTVSGHVSVIMHGVSNYRKSLIQHCERSELRSQKFMKMPKIWRVQENLKLAVEQRYQTGQY